MCKYATQFGDRERHHASACRVLPNYVPQLIAVHLDELARSAYLARHRILESQWLGIEGRGQVLRLRRVERHIP